MWLETLTLQTHQSKKPTIEKLYREVNRDTDFSTTAISVFYHQNSVLHVTWHLEHEGEASTDCTIQSERLIEMLRLFGPVHHRNWQPLKLTHFSDSNYGDNYAN